MRKKVELIKSLKDTFYNFIFSIILVIVAGLVTMFLNFEGLSDIEGNIGVLMTIVIPSIVVLIPLLLGIFISYLIFSNINNKKIFFVISLLICILLGFSSPILISLPSFINIQKGGHFGWEVIGIIIMFVAATLLLITNYLFMLWRLKNKYER